MIFKILKFFFSLSFKGTKYLYFLVPEEKRLQAKEGAQRGCLTAIKFLFQLFLKVAEPIIAITIIVFLSILYAAIPSLFQIASK